jgi:hypothetical protein
MVLMITCILPTTSIPQFTKVVLKNFEELPFPDYVRPVGGPYGLLSEDGAKTIAILEIDKGKEDEGLDFLNKRCFKYAPVEGYKQKTEFLLTMPEVLSYLDLEHFGD